MYIEPNSTFHILKNCPLDTTYEHTIIFDSKSTQADYFIGLKKYTLERQSYQRVQRGYMRVDIQAENLYDCNYLMFKNTAFGSKWFYAFIKSVEYINNRVSQIEFEIDVMQTWHFDYKLQKCFVEREHSKTDNIGDNLIDEKLNLGEYVSTNVRKLLNDGEEDMYVYFLTTVEIDYQNDYPATDGYYNVVNGKPIFSGLNLAGSSIAESGENTKNILHALNEKGKIDSIVSAYYTPVAGNSKSIVNLTGNPYGGIGYTPKNKKLHTYPYTFIYVSNNSGNSAVYKNEFFDNNTSIEFELYMDCYPNSVPVLTPKNYKNVTYNVDERITGKPYPQIAFNNDIYKQWLARSGTEFLGKLSSNVVGGTATGAITGGGVGALAGAGIGVVSSITSTIAEGVKTSVLPPQAKGTPQSLTDYITGATGFYTCHKVITKEFAKIIDNFFDRYGYATHLNKVPNRNVRPNWCYTKTVGCTIKGSVPCDDMKQICSIYDKGITFWKDGNNVGNYDLDNTV